MTTDTSAQPELWFLTGSQHLYGEDTLRQVAEQSQAIVKELDASGAIPARVVWKPILAAVTVIAGLAVMASVGTVGESGVTWWWPLVPVAGMVVFRVIRAGERSDWLA